MDHGSIASARFAFGPFVLHVHNRELERDGRRTRLAEQPFRVLELLLEAPGSLVTRDEIRRRLWLDDTFVDFDHGLNNAIKRLRDALHDQADKPRYIETVPRRGYRFVCPVESLKQPVPASGARRRWPLAVAAGLLLTVIAVAGRLGWSSDLRLGRSAPHTIGSIAVLPLRTLEAGAGDDLLGEGLTDALITELGKLNTFRVISLQSVAQYRETIKSLPDIARELGVDAIVEGTVLRAGQTLRITASLVQAAPERQLFSETYERPFANVIEIQSEVARSIARRIDVKLMPRARRADSRPINPRAYEAYLRGRDHFRRNTAPDAVLAREFLEKAVAEDPTYPEASASLALLFAVRGNILTRHQLGGRVHARKYAAKALELDDTESDAYVALAVAAVADWDWKTAEQNFKQALEANSNDPSAHLLYANYLAGMQRHDQSVTHAEVALRQDPASASTITHAGWIYFRAGRRVDAERRWQRALEIDSEYAEAHRGLAYLCVDHANFPGAIAELHRALAVSGREPMLLGELANVYARGGLREEALKLVGELASGADYSPSYRALAFAYAGLSEPDRAFAALESAWQRHSGGLLTFNIDPMLAPLRSDPRFHDLARRIGLPAVADSSGH